MFSKDFWKRTGERAIKTGCQAAVLVIGADMANVFTLDWQQIFGFGLGGAVLSVLTSVGSAPFGDEGTPSLVSRSE